jgi:hypothetical protein
VTKGLRPGLSGRRSPFHESVESFLPKPFDLSSQAIERGDLTPIAANEANAGGNGTERRVDQLPRFGARQPSVSLRKLLELVTRPPSFRIPIERQGEGRHVVRDVGQCRNAVVERRQGHVVLATVEHSEILQMRIAVA